jgi:hypothetical protein
MKTGRADASRIERVPLVSAGAEPFVVFARRPAAERAADARRLRLARLLIVLKLALWNNGGSISRWTHLSGSLNSLFFGKAAPIPPDHPYFLAA